MYAVILVGHLSKDGNVAEETDGCIRRTRGQLSSRWSLLKNFPVPQFQLQTPPSHFATSISSTWYLLWRWMEDSNDWWQLVGIFPTWKHIAQYVHVLRLCGKTFKPFTCFACLRKKYIPSPLRSQISSKKRNIVFQNQDGGGPGSWVFRFPASLASVAIKLSLRYM